MAIDIKLQEHAIISERSHDIHARFTHVELLLRNLISKTSSIREPAIIDKIKHSIMIFAMKDKVCEDNEIFIENTKEEFYDAIDKLIKENRSFEWDLFYIKLFVEDFYLDPIQNDSSQLSMKIDDLNISLRARGCLQRHGIKTVDDCINIEIDPMRIRNMGIKAVTEISQALKDLGVITPIWEQYLPENQSI